MTNRYPAQGLSVFMITNAMRIFTIDLPAKI